MDQRKSSWKSCTLEALSIELRQYQAQDKELWDDFVWKSRNGTIFHTRQFLSYHDPKKFTDHSFIFSKDGAIVGVLTGAMEGKTFVSHPGASYGGIVLSPELGMKETGEMLDALIEYGKKEKWAGVTFLRLTPPSVRKYSSDDQEYWLHQKGFQIERFELASSLFLKGKNAETLPDTFTGKCRNALRKAEKSGLTFKETDDFKSFWKILESTLTERHQSKPTHSIDEIESLKKLFPKHIRLFAAFKEKEMIGGIVTFTLHDKAIYTLYIAQNYEHQELRSVHLIVTELARVCIKEGKDVLHFGISTEEKGKVVNDGLFFFKESFGAVSVRRESWSITF